MRVLQISSDSSAIMKFIVISTVLATLVALVSTQACNPRDDGHGSVSCVCTATFCDYPEPITIDQLNSGIVRAYTSSQAGQRLESSDLQFTQDEPAATVNYTIRRDKRYQEIIGFGGAMTDAAGINIASLSEGAQENILKAYFSPEGIGYSIIRVPIGGSDFSTHYYSYDDGNDGDTSLEHWALQEEDTKYKIPYIQKALELSTETPIKIFGSSWSPPDWMKNINGATSSLKPEYYQTYADYYVKFLQAYKDNNINIWGVTLQNEPNNGLLGGSGWNSMGFYAADEGKLIVENIAPTFERSGFSDVNIMICDDQRTAVQEWTDTILGNATVNPLVDGTAVHWYSDGGAAPTVLDDAYNKYPGKFLLYTEACAFGIPSESLGTFDKAIQYMTSIIEVTSHSVAGWTDWNMVLSMAGGPNWVNNNVDAPIIVNPDNDEFYKQPMFYALAHVAKFVTPGSVRIDLDETHTGNWCERVVFERPDGATVLVIQNGNAGDPINIRINDPDKGNVVVSAPGRGFVTVIYK